MLQYCISVTLRSTKTLIVLLCQSTRANNYHGFLKMLGLNVVKCGFGGIIRSLICKTALENKQFIWDANSLRNEEFGLQLETEFESKKRTSRVNKSKKSLTNHIIDQVVFLLSEDILFFHTEACIDYGIQSYS